MRIVGMGRAELVDDAGQGKSLDKTRLYGTEEDQFMVRMISCINQYSAQVQKTLVASEEDPVNRTHIG